MRRLILLSWLAVSQVAAAGTPISAVLEAPDRPTAERLLDAGRKPDVVLELLQLAPGQRVLDMVAGGGYYSRLLAPLVAPGGTVFAQTTEGLLAVDSLQPRWSVLKRQHPNVRLLLGVPGAMLLPQGLDRVFFHLTFHDLWWEDADYRVPRMDPALLLRQLHAAVAPGGLVLIVDHAALSGAEPRAETMARHRIDPGRVTALMTEAGFVPDAQSDLLANPADDRSRVVYDPAVRGKTDRFILRFRRP
jgi:predicted methyltransferase